MSNGIHIQSVVQSAIFPQYTLQTDRPTDRLTVRETGLYHDLLTPISKQRGY